VLLNLNHTHQLLLCGYDVSLLGENINAMTKKQKIYQMLVRRFV
jgi:hypothetical protein